MTKLEFISISWSVVEMHHQLTFLFLFQTKLHVIARFIETPSRHWWFHYSLSIIFCEYVM